MTFVVKPTDPETISNWFDELAAAADVLMLASELPPAQQAEVKRLLHIGFDIVETVVVDLNRNATALERIAAALCEEEQAA